MKQHVFSVSSLASTIGCLALAVGCSDAVVDNSNMQHGAGGSGSTSTGSPSTSATTGTSSSTTSSGSTTTSSGSSTSSTSGSGGASGTTTTSTGTGSGTGGSGGGSGGAKDAGTDPCLAGTLIDDLETQTKWGEWKVNHDPSPGMIMPPTFAAQMSSDGHGYAAHVSGSGYTQWGAGLVRSFDPKGACIMNSTGVKFRAKGPATISFAAAMSDVLTTDEGGTCTSNCNNSHEMTEIVIGPTWEDKTITWSSLTQPNFGTPVPFNASHVLQLLFTARQNHQPFDFWIDDIVLTGGSGPIGPGPGLDAGPPGSCVLDAIVGETNFNAWFPGKNHVYTYAGLCTALSAAPFTKFAHSGNTMVDKQEVAAFFAHVAWETGNLVYTDQQSKDPTTGMYWGRGPLQLTWDYNYNACGQSIGQPLLQNPNLVSTDPVITWQTALWFWLYADSGKGFTSHDAISRGSFGDTLRVINSIECNAGNSAQQGRINNYQNFCNKLMVSPGTQLTCM